MEAVTVGKFPNKDAERDAIHVALAPVVAGTELAPGQHVGLNAQGEAVSQKWDTIGIVDPFLKATVTKGQIFWLFLYPNTVTSLRHKWTHPAFAEENPPTGDVELSKLWLEDYAQRLGISLQELIDGTHDGGCIGTDIQYPSDVPSEYWRHFAIYTGKDVIPSERWGMFRCAC